MIIKKVTIENYLCYCGVRNFELTDGLNIILGENGEGKTKFFEALDWLFNGNDDDLDLLVSAKALEEAEIGSNFKVKVSIVVEQDSEKKIIGKSFFVKKIKANESVISNYMLEGVEENKSGERLQVDGKNLLDKIFPFQIRKYSMFKGEAELNIFKSDGALTNLINLFSEAKHYEKYSEKGSFLREKAEKAVEESTKSDKNKEAAYKKLEWDIKILEDKKHKLTVYLNSTDEEIRKIESNLQAAGSYVKNASALETINKRIKKLDELISDRYRKIDENYTTALFDESWIAVNFEPIHHEFAQKISRLSIERRKLQSEFDMKKGMEEGEKKAKAELLNNAIPLPDGIPSKAIMEEMLTDHICKVCNTQAPEGSKQYLFMQKRLETYLISQSHKQEKHEETGNKALYKYDYTNRLVNLSVTHEDNLKKLREIRENIKNLFEFNANRKKEIEEFDEQLEKEKSERDKILGNSNIAEEKLVDVLKNYNAWQDDLKQRNQEHIDYNSSLKSISFELKEKLDEKEGIDLKSANLFLIKTRSILRDIETIFKDTKEIKFDEFIERLQTKSNTFFAKINVESFTGTIVFKKVIKSNKSNVDIELQEDGRTFYKPNQSLLTSMHISILFAISELASEIKEENFPMIFDAPTSSFGQNKTAEFLNLIYETENQKILLIKDFLSTDKETKALTINKEFDYVRRDKAFWIKLERPFDKNNLKTINTQVITL